MTRTRTFAALLLFLLLWPLQGVRAAVSLADGQVSRPVTDALQYFQDDSGRMGLEQALAMPASRWQQNGPQTFSHGYTPSHWWLRFQVDNPQAQPARWLLELAYPVLDHVEVWILSPEGRVEQHHLLGDKQPFHERLLQHRFFLIPLDLSAASGRTVVMRLHSSSSMQAPLTLWEERAYHEQDQHVLLVQGLFFGGMALMALYSFFVFIALRDRLYFYYVVFVFCVLGFLASLKGLSFQFLWPQATAWNDRVLVVTLALMMSSGGLFTLRFLRLRQYMPRYFWLALGLVLLAGAHAVMAFFRDYATLMRPLIVIAAISCLVFLSGGVWRWSQGDRSARFYSIAWSSMLLGGVVLAMNKFQWLPQNFITENAMQLGVAAELILLSLAIVDRINEDRRQRHKAQQEIFQSERRAYEAQAKALAAEKEANERLEQRVNERTLALQEANLKLEELSTSDQLTGLRNRRYLDRVLQEECCRSHRYRHSMAVLLLDVDHFKRFNDQWGHDAGDECLRRVAAVLAISVRNPVDHVARYGGEEFCVVMPETDAAGAYAVAERIRQGVESMEFMIGDMRVPVTISVGIMACVPPDENYSREFLKQADIMLYQSKGAGRNCVSLSEAVSQG
ncbi:MAG TPA: diguanylate cyclase [Candidatus Kapabacteria bacterium]|nr:diguanylate cyclase [Candidatus Kapabacteria bacterium]